MLLSPRDHHLLIIEDDKGRREFVLTAPLYSIGRDPTCDIRLVSQFVSRRHATLVQLPNEDGSFYHRIVDGNARGKVSANGLLINGRKLQACKLQHEDEIVFGPQVRAIYYLHRRNDDEPPAGDEPSSPVGRGGGDGKPNDSAITLYYHSLLMVC
jgi:pSer/pThr/pTyr-binding forkhead associated (FHA) protein